MRGINIVFALAVVTIVNLLTDVQGCGGPLIAPIGNLNSPGYAQHTGQYGNNQDCEWIISTSAFDTSIQLTFGFFDLEYHVDCNYDYVEVFGGPDMLISLGKFCGSTMPHTLTAEESMRVVFHSDGSMTKKGFFAWYKNKRLPKDCSGDPNGLGFIRTTSGRVFRAKCEDGWLIVANREDGSVDFNKNWQDFKDGFGSLDGEHFLGFENIRSVLAQGEYEMRTSFTSWVPETLYIDYEEVSISDEASGYRLKYKWPATKGTMKNAKGVDLTFTTKDRDNDKWASGNCAVKYKGPGWFGACLASNQFGQYIQGSTCPGSYECMTWGSGWPKPMDGTEYNSKYSFKAMNMKIKPSA